MTSAGLVLLVAGNGVMLVVWVWTLLLWRARQRAGDGSVAHRLEVREYFWTGRLPRALAALAVAGGGLVFAGALHDVRANHADETVLWWTALAFLVALLAIFAWSHLRPRRDP